MSQTPNEILSLFKSEQRESYLNAESYLMKNYESFDKAMLTLSTGAIGLIILLYQNIKPCERIYLDISAFTFILSIISILLSFLFGILSFKRQLVGLLRRGNLEEFDIHAYIRPFQIWTDICNIISGAAFTIGVILTVTYIIKTYN